MKKSILRFGRTATPLPALVEQKRDEARMQLLGREKEDLLLRMAAGQIEAHDRVATIDREIRSIERQNEARESAAVTAADIALRRQRDMPKAEADLRADVEHLAEDLQVFAARATDLRQRAEQFYRLYGHEVGGHKMGIPMWFALIWGPRSFDAVFRGPLAHYTLWQNLAVQFGFAVDQSRAA